MKPAALVISIAASAPGVAWAQMPVSDPTAPVAPAEAPAPAAEPAPAPPADGASPAPAPPGDEYYVEPSGPEPAGAPPPFEPPVPGRAPYEPPPPQEAPHLTPKTALWLGARLGLFVPFGNVWADGVPTGDGNSYYY